MRSTATSLRSRTSRSASAALNDRDRDERHQDSLFEGGSPPGEPDEQTDLTEGADEPPAAGPGQLTLDPTFDYRSARRRGEGPDRPGARALISRLAPEQRLAGAAAIGLIGSLVLPWWQQSAPPHLTNAGLSHISFIELALIMVCGAILFLLLRRAEAREFHMPLADGTLAALAGFWCGFLLIYRMIDAPSLEGTRQQYDPHWGIAVAFGLAVTIFAAGVRGRQRFHGGTSEALAADQDASPTAPIPEPPEFRG